MALTFKRLNRAGTKALLPGSKLTEGGITVERTSKGDLRWSVNIMVDHQRIHRVVGLESEGVTREQAERAIESLRTHAREQRLNLPKGRKAAPLFEQAASDYLSRLADEGGKAVHRKERHLSLRLVPFFSKSRLDGITGGETSRYARLRQSGGAKPGTVNRELATLSHMLRSSARWGWITKDQVPDVTRLKEGAGRIVALNPSQCGALLEAARADQDADLWLFVSICLQTSMRHGEARRLRW